MKKYNILNKVQVVAFFYFAFLCISSSILFSCDNSKDKISNAAKFQKQIEITPLVTYLEGASKQLDLIFLENYYVIQNDVEANQNQLSVYDKTTNKHLYSFAVKGHGRNETMAMDMIQNTNGDTLEIIDQAKYKILKYKLDSKKATFLSSKSLKLPFVGPLQEVYRINDSIIIFNTLEQYLQTYNEKKEKTTYVYSMLDSLGLNGENRNFADFHFAYKKNKVCIGFRCINAITIGSVNEFGEIKITNIKSVKNKINLSAPKRTYYCFVDINDTNILAQYMGYEPGFVSKASNYKLYNPKFEIEIYSLNLTPFKHIVSKSDILRCKINEKGNYFYSWNPLDNKENILQFKY